MLSGFPSRHPESGKLAGDPICQGATAAAWLWCPRALLETSRVGRGLGGPRHRDPLSLPAQAQEQGEHTASPLMEDTADGGQPVDAEGVLSLPSDHGGDRDGRWLPAVAPALVHQVQVAVHAGHLVGGEAVGAVIVWGQERPGRGLGHGNARPLLLVKLFRGLLGRAGRHQRAEAVLPGLSGEVCPQSHKMALPQRLQVPAPARHRHLGSATARTAPQEGQQGRGTAPPASLLLAWQEKRQPPAACLGNQAKRVQEVIINNNNNNDKIASGLENKGTHRQEQPWCMSSDPLAGREGWIEIA